MQHTYSCLYGTFLANNPCEREKRNIYKRTCSVWALLRAGNKNFHNFLYTPGSEMVSPGPYPPGASPAPAGRCPEAAGRTRTQRLGKEWGPETSPEPGYGAASLGPASRVSRPGAAPLDSRVPAGVISVHTWGGEHGPLPLPGGSEPGVLRPLSGQVRGGSSPLSATKALAALCLAYMLFSSFYEIL